MAATDFTWGGYPIQGADIPILNTDASNNFAVGDAVIVDATNFEGTTGKVASGQSAIGATGGTLQAYPFGVMIDATPQLAMGRARTAGCVAANANGAITAGAIVGLAALRLVVTQTAAKPQLGQALNTTVNSGDPCHVHIKIANNA